MGEDDSGSLDSDSDLILDGENAANANLMDSDEDDEEELEVNEMAAETLKNRKSAKPGQVPNPSNIPADSDDDF